MVLISICIIVIGIKHRHHACSTIVICIFMQHHQPPLPPQLSSYITTLQRANEMAIAEAKAKGARGVRALAAAAMAAARVAIPPCRLHAALNH